MIKRQNRPGILFYHPFALGKQRLQHSHITQASFISAFDLGMIPVHDHPGKLIVRQPDRFPFFECRTDIGIIFLQCDLQSADRLIQRGQRIIADGGIAVYRDPIEQIGDGIDRQLAAELSSVSIAVCRGDIGKEGVFIIAFRIDRENLGHCVAGNIENTQLICRSIKDHESQHIRISAIRLDILRPARGLGIVVNAHQKDRYNIIPVLIHVSIAVDPVNIFQFVIQLFCICTLFFHLLYFLGILALEHAAAKLPGITQEEKTH